MADGPGNAMDAMIEIRRELADACHRLHAKGLGGEGGGTVSMRVPGQLSMAVTPRHRSVSGRWPAWRELVYVPLT